MSLVLFFRYDCLRWPPTETMRICFWSPSTSCTRWEPDPSPLAHWPAPPGRRGHCHLQAARHQEHLRCLPQVWEEARSQGDLSASRLEPNLWRLWTVLQEIYCVIFVCFFVPASISTSDAPAKYKVTFNIKPALVYLKVILWNNDLLNLKFLSYKCLLLIAFHSISE